MTFARVYHRWNIVHALVLCCVIALSFVSGIAPTIWIVGAAWGAGAMALLYVFGRRLHVTTRSALVPDTLTAVRALTAVALLTCVGSGSAAGATGSVLWALTIVLLAVELTDFLDGRIARQIGASEFGATWDMECDALFTLALAVTAYHLTDLSAFVLAIGAMRYVYVVLWRYDGDPPRYPRVYKVYAKTVAATIVVTLIVVLAPIIGSALRTAAVAIVLSLQTVSFLWDLVLHVSAVRGSAGPA
jgi:phosphatidylglycerophosphate synthase